MNPAAIAAEAKKAGLPASIELPTIDIAGKPINTGCSRTCFASYMRIHALEASGGLTYAQMPRFATADGKGTNDAAKALKSSSGQPLDNPLRAVWISETALSTALNTSYMAEQVALFGIVVGIALALERDRLPRPDARRRAPGTCRRRPQRRSRHRARRVGHRLSRAPSVRRRRRPQAAFAVSTQAAGAGAFLVQQALRERVADELGPGLQAELLHDVGAMGLGRANRDVEHAGDLLIGVAEGQEAQDVALSV